MGNQDTERAEHHDNNWSQSKFDTIPPQLLTSLTAKDYVDVLKEARWNNDYRNMVICKYLGAKSVDQIIFSSFVCSEAISVVYRYVILEYFTTLGLKVEKIGLIDSDGDYPPSFSAIEISSTKSEDRLVYGDYFVSDATGTNKYIVHLESTYPDAFTFRFASLKTVKPDCNALSAGMEKYGKDHNFLKGQKIDPGCNFIKLNKKFTWDDLILEDEVKVEIQRNIKNLIEYEQIYKKNGLQIKRGLILAGEPGTGKTVLAKILCNQIDWTFIWVTSKHLESPKHMAQIVKLARDLSPTVLFLEDLDLFGGSREHNSNPMMLGELMNQLDGIEENSDILVIATTNNKDMLEKALVSRPGRFDKVIDFPLPKKAERLKMLKAFSNGLITEDNPYIDRVAAEYKKKTGAQIRELVNMAIIFAIDDKSYDENDKLIIKEDHFEKAMKNVKAKDFKQISGFTPGASSPIGRHIDFDD